MKKNMRGMGACSPHNGSKLSNALKVCLFTFLIVFSLGMMCSFLFGSLNNDIGVSADSYLNPTNWETVYFTNMNNFNGRDVWTDGTNYYYDANNSNLGGVQHLTLDVDTLTWSTHSWTGYTGAISGNNIWYDNGRVFYSSSSTQKIFTGTGWSNVTWTGISSGTPYNGTNVFQVFGYSWVRDSSHFRRLDPTSYVWSTADSYFTGLPTSLGNFNRDTFWTDGVRYYYSNGDSTKQYYYDDATSSWTVATWTGLINNYNTLVGSNIWTDGSNIYLGYSYKLNIGTFTWSAKSFVPSGVPSYASSVFDIVVTNENTVYYCYNGNNYRLVHDVIPALDIQDPTVSQSSIFQVFDYSSNTSYLNRLGLNVYVATGTDYSNGTWNKFLAYDFSSYSYTVGSSVAVFNDNILVTTLPYAHIKYELYELGNTVNTNISYLNMTAFDLQSTTLNVINPSSHNSYFSATFNFSNIPNSWIASNVSVLNGFCVSYFGVIDCSLYNYFNNTIDYVSSNAYSIDVYMGMAYFDYNFYTFDDLSTYSPRCVLYNVHYDVRLQLNNNYTFNYYTKLNTYFATDIITSYSGLTIYDIGTTSTAEFFTDIEQTTTTFSTPVNIIYGSLATPVITYNPATVSFSWAQIPGADYYQIYFNNTLLVDNYIGNSYTVTEVGSYYIMALSNSAGVNSSTSNTLSITAVVLDTPTISLTYSLISWDAVSNADGYIIYIYDNDNNTWVNYSNIKTTTYVLIATGSYCVQAYSNSSLFTVSSLSNSISFTGVWSPTGSTDGNSFASLIGAVVDVPIHYFTSMFDFDMDFLGFNMLNLIMSIFTLCVLIWIIRFLLGRFGGK